MVARASLLRRSLPALAVPYRVTAIEASGMMEDKLWADLTDLGLTTRRYPSHSPLVSHRNPQVIPAGHPEHGRNHKI